MFRRLNFYFLLVLLLNFLKVNGVEEKITVAVVEHQILIHSNTETPDEVLTQNAVNYIKVLEELVETGQELDLIVYPESVLVAGGSLENYTNFDYTTYVEIGDNPCNSRDENKTYPEFMISLSCAAQNYETFLVVNLFEKVLCDQSQDFWNQNCKNYGHFLHNTDVIFDRNGTITQRYRKSHLFNEPYLDAPLWSEVVTFSINTQTFGIFTCFDILFQNPALDLVNEGITNLIFPNMWFAELPFATSLQIQQMWAHENSIRLFSAGANNPPMGSGGSGIYDGANGPIVYDIVAEGGTKAYVANWNGNSTIMVQDENEIDDLARKLDNFLLRAENLTAYSYTVLNSSNMDVQQEVICTDNGFCCEFVVQIDTNFDGISDEDNYYSYQLVAFSNARPVNDFMLLGADICGVVACLNSTIESCAQRFPDYDTIRWPITFKSLKIEATFPKGNRMQFPNSLLSSLRPLLPQQTLWSEENISEREVKKTFELIEPQNRLLTFSIFGRNYDFDLYNSGNIFTINFTILIIGLVINNWF